MRDFIAVSIARCNWFQVVDDGDRLFGFLLRPLLFVLLYDCVSLLDLVLVSFDLVSGKLYLTHALEQGRYGSRCQAVLCEAEVLQRPVGLENAHEVGDNIAAEGVVAQV